MDNRNRQEISDDHDRNYNAFLKALPALLVGNEGRWAVGRAGDEFTCWDIYSDALQSGYAKYGLNTLFFGAKINK